MRHILFISQYNSIYDICINFRYDPYERKLTREYYDHDVMKATRLKAIERAKGAKTFGLVLGTLGRQGSTKVLDYFHVWLILKCVCLL